MTPARAARIAVSLLRRSMGSALVLLGASSLLFAVVRAAPGGASGLGQRLSGSSPPPAETPRPDAEAWPLAYARWVLRAALGDFGRSTALQQGRPVGELLIPAAVRSLGLAGAGLGLSALAALALALYRTLRPRSCFARGAGVAAHVLSAVPVFLYVYAAVACGNWLLAWGAREALWSLPGWFPFPARDSWVPWLVAAGILAVGDSLLLDLYGTFSVDLEVARSQDHLIGARLLGLSVPGVVARGFLPGAASHLSGRMGLILSSLVVLESALGWPGLGYLAWRAAAERDLPVLLGVTLVLAAGVQVWALVTEAIWRGLDPRSGAVR